MTDETRTPITNRALALLAGPFLLGQRALSLVFQKEDTPEAEPRTAASRITITPPEHAIKRRG